MAKSVKRPAKKKAAPGGRRRGITPAADPVQAVQAEVPRSPRVVIPSVGTDTPSRILKRQETPPSAARDEGEHSARFKVLLKPSSRPREAEERVIGELRAMFADSLFHSSWDHFARQSHGEMINLFIAECRRAAATLSPP